MINILDYTYSEFENFLVHDLKEPKFRAVQIWQWIWQKLVFNFEEMSDLSKKSRILLAEHCTIDLPELVLEQQSIDGTRKLLLKLNDGALIETVLIPGEQKSGQVRLTQCLSCQVGCAMACTFCHTGKMGFIRNMSSGEILSQVLIAKKILGDKRVDHPIIRNAVFMGMGEPLLNFKQLIRSLETFNHPHGLSFSPRRITVSTSGIKKGLHELGDSNLAFLALSLHAPNQKLREQIMPKAAHYHLDELLSDLASYHLKSRETLTLEYLLLGGVNDQPEHAQELAKIVLRLRAKLNLIIYNPPLNENDEKEDYQPPSAEAVENFQKILWDKKITAILRKSKGQDIMAACGQLKTNFEAKNLH